MQYGDIVKVRNTMLYNGQIGMVGPVGSDPDDPWDFYVDLIDGRTIGVMSGQVEAL